MTRRLPRLPGALAGALIASSLIYGHVAATTACTSAGVNALFQQPLIAGFVMGPRGVTRPLLAESLADCHYGFYRDGSSATFVAGEPFMGGIIWFTDYVNQGILRSAAVADINLIGDRVWLARVLDDGSLGPFVEQQLMRTAFKDFQTSAFGVTVYQQRGFIIQLEAGEYVSYWESTYPGTPTLSATAYLRIVPGS